MKRRRNWISGAGALILAALAKLKFLLLFFKFSKFGVTFISMFVTIAIYTIFFGWKFAIGFVILIYIHENGHLIAAKIQRLRVSKPVFIPFFGAFIQLKEQPRDAQTEAFVAFGGPVLGGLASFVCYAIYASNHSSLFLSLAYIGFWMNLFNLIPIHPLDGGRIVTAIHRGFWILGIVILGILSFAFMNPFMFLILFFGIFNIWNLYKNPNPFYYQVSPVIRVSYTLFYFFWVFLLGFMMVHSYHLLHMYQTTSFF